MNNLRIFDRNTVEIFEKNGEMYFNPYNVGKCLGLKKSAVRMTIRKMTLRQACKFTNSDVKDSNIRKLNNAGELFLTESGVYKLAFRSNKKEAERFTDWVINEVLPSIRKTGSYSIRKEESMQSRLERLIQETHEVMLAQHQQRKEIEPSSK